MEKKIDAKLKDYGFTRKDLTKEELDCLKNEIQEEEKGNWILDGVLAFKSRF